MIFTDDYKKRLEFSIHTFCASTINPLVLEALLTRLEAAEGMMTPLQAFLDFHGEKRRDIYCMDGMERTKYFLAKERLDAWHRAAGK